MTFGRDLTEDQKKQIVPKTNVSNEVLVRIKYEKLKNWQTVKKEIQSLLDNPDWIETAITLVYGPQLVYTMRHPRIVQSMTHFKTSLYDMFTTQYKSGNDQEFGVWLLGNRDGNISTKHARFSTSSVVTALTFVSKHGVYLAFTQDLFLKVFTDRFVEVYKIFWLTTVLCLVYNRVLDEIYIGGIGLLEIWKIQGTEHAAVPVLVKKCDVTLTEDDWVQEIKFDNNLDLLYAMCGMGIVVFNTKTQKQVHYLTSTLLGTLRSFCLYTRDEYIVTGEMDGSIKVWGSNVFSQVHQFHDHCEAVTALNVHRCDPLLFSSSLDGVLFIWRMDNFCKYMRLDLGEKIYKMKLISDTLFFCQIEKEIKIFSLNQFYQMFAPVESDIFKLVCSRGMGKSSKIVCSTQDGSVRLISPESGQTYTIMYPLSSFQVMTQVAYDVHQSRLHIVLSDGSILINNCLTNPCQMEEIWSSEFEDEQIMEITMVIVMYSSGENEDGYQIDHLLFAGLQNGQIILADAFISTLEEPHQAHEGKIICLDSGARVDKSGCAVDPCSQILISGGTDGFVCVWQIHVTERARQLLIHLTSLVRIDIGSVPVYCCMSENILAVVHVHHAGNEDNWLLTMYHMKKWDVKNSHCNDIEILTHCVSEDHGTKITALDKCPVLGLFLTCGEDSYLKIWNSKNQLIREMSFGQPLYAACFANDRGDILFGFQKHLCSISIASYLPLDYLETVVKFDFKDSEYEYPLQFDVHITPGLELVNVQKYPQQLSERRSLKLEKKIVSQIKKIYEEKQSEKFRIYINGGKSVGNYFAGKLKEFDWKKLIRKEKIKEHAGKELAVATIGDRLKEAHRRKVDFEEEGEEDIGLKGKALAIARIVNRLRRAPKRKVVNFEEFERNSSSEVLYSDEDGEVNCYSLEDELKLLVKNVSVDNTHLSILSHYKMRIELEDKLYKRDPIIARDGYIPNSVIRKKLNPPPSPPPSPKKPWTLKPVPKPDRRHMPEYWEPEDDSVSSEEDKCLERFSEPDKEVPLVVDNWEDESSSNSSRASSLTFSPSSESHEFYHGKNKIDSDAVSNVESEVSSEFEESSEGDDSEIIKLNEEEDDETVVISDAKTMADKLEVMEDESEKNTVPSSERSSYERDYSRFSKRRGVPNTPPILPQSSKDVYESRGLYTIKPQTFPFQNINRIQEKSIRRGQSDEEKKPTSAVIQPSAAEPPADLQPTEKLENEMEDSEFLRQLQQGLLSLDGEINLELLLQRLLKYLNHPDINIQQRVMEWLCIIQEKKGIPDVYREQVVAQIIEKVNTTPLSRVKMFSIESLAFVGYQRADCITQMLINMADQNEDVQIAACEGLAHITGVRDKDALIQKLDVMGITGVYNSKEDEEQAMSLLGDKFGTEKDEYFQQRIRKWIESASPSSAMNNFKADEIEDMLHQQHGSWEEIQILAHHGHVRREQHLSMYPDGGTSRSTDRLKELSFLSDEMDQNSVFDAFNPSGPNTFIDDDPTPITLGSASDLALSRGVSLYEPKSARSQGVISGGGRSSKSKYNYRIDLMDRLGASVQHTERFENDMPLYDIEQTPSLRGTPFDNLYRDLSHATLNKTGISLMDDRKLDSSLSKAGSTTVYDANPLSNGTSQIDGSPLNSSDEEREANNDASMEFDSPRINLQDGSSPINSSADENYEENSVEIEDSPRSQESPGISGTTVQHDGQTGIRSPTKTARVDCESSEELITPKSDVSPRTQVSSRVDRKVSQLSIETLYDVKISPETVMENLRLKSEGTNLSLLGPLPTITKQDTVSHDLEVDSAISTLSIGESEPQTFTVSEIGGFSEVVTTMSHLDSQFGDGDSDFTDLEKFDIDSGMWSPTTKKQKIHTTDTEYTRKTQGYETGSVGSAVKKGTMKTQGFETGSAESSVKRSHLTNPKALSMYKYYDQRHLREQSGSQGSEEMKKEPDLLRGGRLDPDRLKDKSLKPELNKRTLSFASADFFLKPEFKMHKSSFSSAELSTKHESMMHKSGFPNADVSTKSEYVMRKSSFRNADMLTKPELMMHKSSYFSADMLNKPEIIIHKPSFAHVDVSTSPEFRKHKSSFTSISKHRRISQYDVMPQTDVTNLGKSDGNNLKDMSTKPELSELSEHKLSFAVNDVSAKPEFRKRKSSISSTDRAADSTCRKRKLSLAYASEQRRMSKADQMPFTDQMIKEGQEESGIGINVPQEESDIQSVAASLLSQEQSAGDAVSTQDSGISRDMSSDFSHERRAKLVAMTSHKSSRLSPVKSVTGLETSMRHSSTVENSAQTSTMEEGEAQIKKEGDWRQFFQLPTAMERRRMNQVKKEKAAGKLRQTHLPPISYFTENLPMLPGEAGMRLLQTVRIGEKVPVDGDHRYRVESLPGKLAVHTQNEDVGLSNFGILQMQWTTGIPNFQSTVSIPPSPPVVPRNSHRYGQHQLSNTKDYFHRFRPSIEDLSSFLPHLMGQGQTTQSHSKNYEWEHPLPPPPEKESRIKLTNMKKDHDNYCKYYKLVKKQLHFYTSKHPEDLQLPEVVVKQADMVSPKKDNVPKQKSNVSKSRSNAMLPPIKVGQLVKVV